MDVARGRALPLSLSAIRKARGQGQRAAETLRDGKMTRNRLSFGMISNNDYSKRIKGYVNPHNMSVNVADPEIALENGATTFIPSCSAMKSRWATPPPPSLTYATTQGKAYPTIVTPRPSSTMCRN